MQILLQTILFSIITSVATAMEFHEALLPVLTQCDIYIGSHRCINNAKFNPFIQNSIDQELEEEALQKLSSRGLPYRFTILSCNDTFYELQAQLYRNPSSLRCITFLWFLRAFRAPPDPTGYLDSRFAWLNSNISTAQDFAVIVYRDVSGTETHAAELDFHLSLQPENILFVTIEENSSNVNYMALPRSFCYETGETCTELSRFNPDAPMQTMGPEVYFNYFAPQSVYSTRLDYNFNGVPLLLNHIDACKLSISAFKTLTEMVRDLGLQGKYVGSTIPFRRPVDRSYRTSRYLETFSRNSNLYFELVGLLHLYENFFNLSVNQYRKQVTDPQTTVQYAIARKTVRTDREPEGQFYRVVTRSDAFHLICVSKYVNEADLSSFINPLDKWTWAASLLSYVTLALVFLKFAKSPFLMLLAPGFERDSGISGKRFSFLVLIWSVSCLLMSNLISSIIASFLVVPPHALPVDNFKDLVEKRFQLILATAPGQKNTTLKDNVFFSFGFGPGMKDLHSRNVGHRQKSCYQFLNNVKILTNTSRDVQSLLDTQIQHGKGCNFWLIRYSNDVISAVEKVYPGYVAVLFREKLLERLETWTLVGPYQSVLSRSLSIFAAAGIIQLYKSAQHYVDSGKIKADVEALMQRKDPYHLERRYFSVGEEERSYLRLLKREQSKLIVCVWASLVAIATGVFLIESVIKGWKALGGTVRQRIFRCGANRKVDAEGCKGEEVERPVPEKADSSALCPELLRG